MFNTEKDLITTLLPRRGMGIVGPAATLRAELASIYGLRSAVASFAASIRWGYVQVVYNEEGIPYYAT